jgi:hypothetical protein
VLRVDVEGRNLSSDDFLAQVDTMVVRVNLILFAQDGHTSNLDS